MQTASPSSMEDNRFTISDADSPPSISHSSQLGSDCQSDHDSQSAPGYCNVEISNIEMNQIPRVGLMSLDDRFWLQIVAEDKIKETSVASRGSLCWQDKFTFNVRKSSKLSFRLYARRYVHENKLIGEVGKRVDSLVEDMLFKGWHNSENTNDLARTTLICRITKRDLSPEEAVTEVAMTRQLRVSNIVVHHLPKVKLISLDDHFFVQIEVDDRIVCITDVRRGHSLQWKNEYLCNYRKDSRIQLKVIANRHLHKDHLVCLISDKVESFLQRGSIREQLLSLEHIGKTHEIPASMEFEIASLTPTPPGRMEMTYSGLEDGIIVDPTTPTTIFVEISDIHLTHLPKIGMVAFNDQFFVQLGVEGGTQTTSSKTQQNGSIRWDEKFKFDVPETALLSLQVYARRHIHSDEYIGMVRNQIGTFLQGSEFYDGQLIVFDPQRKLETKLSFQIRQSSSSHGHSGSSIRSLPTQSRDLQVSPHHDAIAAVRAIPAPLLNGAVQVPAGIGLAPVQGFLNNTLDAFEPLLSRIDTFVRIGRAFSEAHPYAKMAFMVLTAGYEVIRQQQARDENIRKLASTMCESYSLVLDGTDLSRFQGQEETVKMLTRQTIECAYFIRDYALYKSGSTHCISNLFSDIDTTILNYETAFGNIRTSLEQKVVVNTQLVVCRIHDALKHLAAKVDLNVLRYATGASYHARSYDTMLVTDDDLLTEISGWVNDKSSPAIYLLIGPHGSEASAAAYAVARQFDGISRLGSSYCLDRTRQTQRKPTNLFSTIARDLADHDPEFMACLGDMVKRRSIGSSPHIPTQFDFILAPAHQLTSFGPVLVVIDALDACGDENSRAEVLSVLKDKAQNLPRNFKFLITCLPETDVAEALRDKPHVLPKELDAVATKQISDGGFAVGRTKPRPSTPPIQTAPPQSDYFSRSKSDSSVSDISSSSPSSIVTSIFDEGLRTFSPDSDMSSPASSITACADAGFSKPFLGTIKHIETREKCYSFDPDAQAHTITHTELKQTVRQHPTSFSSPHHPPSYALMLHEPNAHLFTSSPTVIPADAFSVIPRSDSPRPRRKKHAPIRQDTLIRSEIQTTRPQHIALLSP